MHCEQYTDEELMARIVDDRELFGCIVERYDAKLRRYLKRLMPGVGEDVDDLLQDVFVKAYVNARGFDRNLKFSSWVYRIAHNEAVSWLRKKKARPETVELGDDEFKTFTESIEDSAVRQERAYTKDEVGRVLASMHDRYRSVLVLQYLEGKSYDEIGDILTVPAGTVATRIHRAKQKFITIYQSQHD